MSSTESSLLMDTSGGPLSEELARLGLCDKPSRDRETRIRVWTQLLKALDDEKRRPLLFSSLTRPQRISLELLDEWWKQEQEPYPESTLRKWFYHGQGSPEDAMGTTNYCRTMFMLWNREIFPIQGDAQRSEYIEMEDLKAYRQLAATSAAGHRMALASIPDIVSQSSTFNNKTRESIHGRISDAPISACMQPCSWLSKAQEDGYPHYLWDLEEMKTVECPENGATYLVISHTWGRWHQPKGKKIKVDGVPWLVPVNTLYDVTDLPRILQNVPFETRYIWLDLLCIPQDGSDLQTSEIARQAAIFSSAKWATVWFNQIDCWHGLLEVIHFMSRAYLKECLKESFGNTTFNDQSEALQSGSTGLVNDAQVYDGWFTSLWTLQEACMRPDLFLCNRHWELLKTKTTTFPITLDHIISLFRAFLSDTEPSSGEILTRPRSVEDTWNLLMESSMIFLQELTLTHVMVLGDRRYCEDDQRAKAIMSALGVTNWYLNKENGIPSSASGELKDRFIETRYPFSFVKEVYQKAGAQFFSTVSMLQELKGIEFSLSPDNMRIIQTSLYGTMLPFVIDGTSRILQVPPIIRGVDDHPSVKTWSLHPDGSVHIRQAGLLAAWPPLPKSEQHDLTSQCIVYAFSAGLTTASAQLDIHKWMVDFRKNCEKYAVVLSRQSDLFWGGIILERVYASEDQQQFIKIGTFYVVLPQGDRRVIPFPPSKKVDWRVL